MGDRVTVEQEFRAWCDEFEAWAARAAESLGFVLQEHSGGRGQQPCGICGSTTASYFVRLTDQRTGRPDPRIWCAGCWERQQGTDTLRDEVEKVTYEPERGGGKWDPLLTIAGNVAAYVDQVTFDLRVQTERGDSFREELRGSLDDLDAVRAAAPSEPPRPEPPPRREGWVLTGEWGDPWENGWEWYASAEAGYRIKTSTLRPRDSRPEDGFGRGTFRFRLLETPKPPGPGWVVTKYEEPQKGDLYLCGAPEVTWARKFNDLVLDARGPYPDGRRFIAEQEDRDDDRVRLDLDTISRTNRERCKRWHDADSEPWTGADWSNAMCGEAGETANVVKKLRRHETGTSPQGDPGETDLRVALADEIADTLLYLLLLADHYSVDVPAAVVSKFNRVSERQGFPERLSLRAPDPVRLESL